MGNPYVATSDKELLDRIAGDDMVRGYTISCNGFFGPQGRRLRLPLAEPKLNERIESFEYEGLRVTTLRWNQVPSPACHNSWDIMPSPAAWSSLTAWLIRRKVTTRLTSTHSLRKCSKEFSFIPPDYIKGGGVTHHSTLIIQH